LKYQLSGNHLILLGVKVFKRKCLTKLETLTNI
jgi:hypothetical protein